MLTGTRFHSRTAALCQAQNWRRWAGYIVAGSYELSHEREYAAIRNAAALIDVSPLFKYLICGLGAHDLLNRVVTRNVTRCQVGQVMYTPWCDEYGKVIDDGTLARLDEQVFRLTSADPSLRWLHLNAHGLRVELEDVSDSIVALALQGPHSQVILQQASDADLTRLKYYRLIQTKLGKVPVTISRTGYTGDLGYEIWMDAPHAEAIWDTLMAAGQPYGITPAGMLALDVARIEAGLLLGDVGYVSAHKALIESQKSSPLELGLEWAVGMDKENFVGKTALLDEGRRGPAWRFVGVQVQWDSLEQLYTEAGLPPQLPTVAWRTSVPLYNGDRQVGYATSGCWSPLLKQYIALAHVESAYARPGTAVQMEVTVEHRRRQAEAQVVRLPFFDPARKRM